jgi:dolichol-phosphate mannosyltransferase
MNDRFLSVVIPAYNEERFIGRLLEKVLAVDLERFGLGKEILVIDDHSADRTPEIARSFPGVELHRLERNSGKGAAVKQGISMATGEFLVIQDADLEYDPADYVPMLEALVSGAADAAYGSRYLRGGRYPGQSRAAYWGGRTLSLVAFVFTGRYLTDTVTALKMFRREVIQPLELRTSGFEMDHEITAKLLARRTRIVEVPIDYVPRTRAQGKKIGLADWFAAVRTFARYRRG